MTETNITPTVRAGNQGGRIDIIDALRGLSIILMIFYHLAVDLEGFGYLPEWLVYNPILGALRDFFAGVFIMLAGVSSRFSRSNIKRGLKILAAALCVTGATWLYAWLTNNYKVTVNFGILHLLSFSVLIYAVFGKFINKIPKMAAPFIYTVLFAVSYIFLPILVPFYGFSIFGFISPVFYTADYFSAFPWLFCFLFGTWLGEPIRQRNFPEWFYNVKIPFLPWAGRHTLLIYVLHQPVLTGLVMLPGLIMGR